MKSRRNGRRSGKFKFILIPVIAAAVAFAGFNMYKTYIADFVSTNDLAELEYDGSIAVEVSGNLPGFTDEDLERAENEDFEEYSDLDEYGRCRCSERHEQCCQTYHNVMAH